MENNYTWNSTYKGMAGKNDFTLEIISFYSPQRDKTLSTSKKKVRNNGTSNQPNPKKIGPKYTKSESVSKIDFSKNIFSRGNLISIGKIQFH